MFDIIQYISVFAAPIFFIGGSAGVVYAVYCFIKNGIITERDKKNGHKKTGA